MLLVFSNTITLSYSLSRFRHCFRAKTRYWFDIVLLILNCAFLPQNFHFLIFTVILPEPTMAQC